MNINDKITIKGLLEDYFAEFVFIIIGLFLLILGVINLK